eukprot:UN00713
MLSKNIKPVRSALFITRRFFLGGVNASIYASTVELTSINSLSGLIENSGFLLFPLLLCSFKNRPLNLFLSSGLRFFCFLFFILFGRAVFTNCTTVDNIIV